jgi:hypothetical protein
MAPADRAMYEAKRRSKGYFIAHCDLTGEMIELAPAPDAGARMGRRTPEKPEAETSRFPLPFRSKSL